MTKLIIQIPCFNEEGTLGMSLDALPTAIPGIDNIERLIIDDGSTDGTLEVARRKGVEHIVRVPQNRGLANAFMQGLDAALKAGADIVVNTDADNQYVADDIEKLVRPVLDGKAEIVVGARPIADVDEFSPLKKKLQNLGSWVVRIVSGTDIPDAPSGFRAFSRHAAMRLNVFNSHTYTLETIIQAGRLGIPITWVPVRVNAATRPSRLMRSTFEYVVTSMLVILRIFMIYRPRHFFGLIGAVPFALGTLLAVRWLLLFLFFLEPGRTHAPSLIAAAVFLLMGFQTWLFGLSAELQSVNRMLLEDIRYRQRRAELADDKDARA